MYILLRHTTRNKLILDMAQEFRITGLSKIYFKYCLLITCDNYHLLGRNFSLVKIPLY